MSAFGAHRHAAEDALAHLVRDEFSEEGAARASDVWNYTTVKRILKNPVYLGHTLLGKSKKVSVKSKKKAAVPRDSWAVTKDTHPPPSALRSRAIFREESPDAACRKMRSTTGAVASSGARRCRFSWSLR